MCGVLFPHWAAVLKSQTRSVVFLPCAKETHKILLCLENSIRSKRINHAVLPARRLNSVDTSLIVGAFSLCIFYYPGVHPMSGQSIAATSREIFQKLHEPAAHEACNSWNSCVAHIFFFHKPLAVLPVYCLYSNFLSTRFKVHLSETMVPATVLVLPLFVVSSLHVLLNFSVVCVSAFVSWKRWANTEPLPEAVADQSPVLSSVLFHVE